MCYEKNLIIFEHNFTMSFQYITAKMLLFILPNVQSFSITEGAPLLLPSTQRQLSKAVKVSQTTLRRIINFLNKTI